ncbi:MAG TPA: helix-turn-helix transcriptional regulator, partial [Ktedonobacterales bacterium]|nr:helix-turn-helix transcriptional regulator [Ktedonobacterales bacterium]
MATLTPLSFGALLKSLRRPRMTQEELAAGAGYSPSYISMLERGERLAQPSTVELLAAALHLSAEDAAALLAARERREPVGSSTLARGDADARAPADTLVDRNEAADQRDAVAVATILVASARGALRLRANHPDPAMADLAARFAALVCASAAMHGGQVLEPRDLGTPDARHGDQLAAIFPSTRQALRAAVALRASCAREQRHDHSWQWLVGIGLHASDAPPVAADSTLGAAPSPPAATTDERDALLAVAQRLCDLAGPGEILAGASVIHLAQGVDGLDSTERGRLRIVD